MPPKPKWKPIVLGARVRLDTLMPSFPQKTKSSTSGVMHSPVKMSDTMRGGRLSGTRNWWTISGRGPDVVFGLTSAIKYVSKINIIV